MKLSIKDRLIIPMLLPQTGGLIEMQLVLSIKDKVNFSAAEISKYQLKDTEFGVKWNTDNEKECDIELTQEQLQVIRNGIKKLDEEKRITADMVSTILKFQ